MLQQIGEEQIMQSELGANTQFDPFAVLRQSASLGFCQINNKTREILRRSGTANATDVHHLRMKACLGPMCHRCLIHLETECVALRPSLARIRFYLVRPSAASLSVQDPLRVFYHHGVTRGRLPQTSYSCLTAPERLRNHVLQLLRTMHSGIDDSACVTWACVQSTFLYRRDFMTGDTPRMIKRTANESKRRKYDGQ